MKKGILFLSFTIVLLVFVSCTQAPEVMVAPDFPGDSVVVQNQNVTLKWNPVEGAASYNLRYALDPEQRAESKEIQWTVLQELLETEITVNLNSGNYIWQVQAVKEEKGKLIRSVWTEANGAKFIVKGLEKPEPVVPQPVSVGTQVKLRWTPVAESATYQVEYSQPLLSDSRGWILIGETENTEITWNAPGSGNYLWRVNAAVNGQTVEGEPNEIEIAEKAEDYYFRLVQYNSGPAVPEVQIVVYNLDGDPIGNGETNDTGFATVSVSEDPENIDVKFYKKGYANSIINNIKTNILKDESQPYESMIRTALIDTDPNTQQNPKLNVSFMDLEGNALDITQTITSNFEVSIVLEEGSSQAMRIYKPMFERVPGTGRVVTGGQLVFDATTVTYELDIEHLKSGEVDLNFILYDYNECRTHDVYYLNVQPTEATLPATPYQVMDNWNLTVNALAPSGYFFPLPNLYSFTRRMGVGYYSDIRGNSLQKDLSKRTELTFEKTKLTLNANQARTAPENSNLWVDIYWLDYDSAEYLSSLVPSIFGFDPLPFDVTQEKPDGYNVYRSFDENNWEKIGYKSSDSIPEYQNESYLIQFSNYYGFDLFEMGYVPQKYLTPMFTDKSAELEPGKRVFYAVTPVYGNAEGDATLLGSVVPLDRFNINMISPSDEKTNVSRNPVFKWEPTKDLGEDVYYAYNIFVYDWVQADNGLMIPVNDPEDAYQSFGYEIIRDNASPVSFQFTGNESNVEGCKWYWFSPYTLDTELYGNNELEANKTYEWGINVAYALTDDYMNAGFSYSIASDFRIRDEVWWVDPYVYGMSPDLHSDFTTMK
jgi:hypothetical protein